MISYRDKPVVSYYENENEAVDFILPVMTQPYDYKKHRYNWTITIYVLVIYMILPLYDILADYLIIHSDHLCLIGKNYSFIMKHFLASLNRRNRRLSFSLR